MIFKEWFKKRNINEVAGEGEELPEDIQAYIKELTPYNDYLYLVLTGNNIFTGNVQMTGDDLINMREDLVKKMEDLYNKNQKDPMYQNADVRKKLLTAQNLNTRLKSFFKDIGLENIKMKKFVVQN